MASGASIVEGFPDQFCLATGALLERGGRIKGISAITRTFALACHFQPAITKRASVGRQEDFKVKSLRPFLEIRNIF